MAYGLYTVWRGESTTYESKSKAMRYEPMQTWMPERIEAALRAKEFGPWPEVVDSKKNTFDNHDKNLRFLHEYFNIPLKPTKTKD